ncbi:MAG: bifunctional riboflavin kinase/FAD synthetase [Candidatus Omnitrophica bacterium]|nr:bifunctional riboflavin kinase/FAD synthetase [Candidatus Omnitrophota bacterium]
MRVIHGIEKIDIKGPTVATIGIFDGVHKGHKKILRLLKNRSKALNMESCVITFDPHPAKVIHPERMVPMLISTRHKLNLLAEEGIDHALLINFSKRFSSLSGKHFIRSILVKRIHVRELYVGENFSFGKEKKTSIDELKEEAQFYSMTIHAVKQLKQNGQVVSSTLIRSLILEGRLRRATALLGRPVSILGTVIRGSRRGRILGFPTANLDLHHEAIPPSGVYIVKVKLKEHVYDGILNIGFRPTFNASSQYKEATAEVHIFDFSDDIYNEELEVVFIKRIRSERRFSGSEPLLERIEKDVEIAKMYFAGKSKS